MKIKATFIMTLILLVTHSVVAQEDIFVKAGAESYFSVDYHAGSEYTWEILIHFSPDTPAYSSDYIFISDSNSNSVRIKWDKPGIYFLKVTEINSSGCSNAKATIVNVTSELLTINAGNDTITGHCNPIALKAYVSDTTGVSFLWEPADNLDDPTSATPNFNPGESTLFTVTVRNNTGETKKDSIYIEVAELIAEAGDEVHKDSLTSIVLDGSESFGVGISYYWSTDSGKIEKDENTPNPTVSGFGVYYLELTDVYGCTSIDSVTVTSLNNPPVNVDPPLSPPLAKDDYDTTASRTAVKISVLANDSDPDDDIDVFSLSITDLPVNGTAYVDYNDFTIHYVPDNSFGGTDYFEYQICDTSQKCANAIVYVNVLEGEFLIPDAFSPNGDNINDYFEIIGIEKYQNNSIVIFNRWGKKVYEALNYGISSVPKFWNGKFSAGLRKSDTELPTGTYYYVLNLGKGKKPLAGSIYLDR